MPNYWMAVRDGKTEHGDMVPIDGQRIAWWALVIFFAIVLVIFGSVAVIMEWRLWR